MVVSDTKLDHVGFPRWGSRQHQLLAILCVILSLALLALGGIDLTDGFALGP
jgi:hypothetical protein